MGANFRHELERLLRQAGCYFVRSERGDHSIWFSPITQRSFTVDGKVLSRHTANGVLGQAGLPKRF